MYVPGFEAASTARKHLFNHNSWSFSWSHSGTNTLIVSYWSQCNLKQSWSVFWVQLLLEWVTANPKDQCHGVIWSPLILIKVEGRRWTANLYNGLLMFISICTCTGLVRVDTFGRGSCGNVIKQLRLGKTVYVCVHLRKSNRSFQHICVAVAFQTSLSPAYALNPVN